MRMHGSEQVLDARAELDRQPGLGDQLAGFVAGTIGQEFYKGIAARRSIHGEALPIATVRLVARNRRRYGAYLAHLGIVVAAIGFAGSHFWQQETQAVLATGETLSIGNYRLTLAGTEKVESSLRTEYHATFLLGGERLEAGRTVYADFGGQSSTAVAIRSTAFEDLYVVLADGTEPGRATVVAFVNPLVPWIWAGAALLILGTLLGSWPGGTRLPEAALQGVTQPALAAGGRP